MAIAIDGSVSSTTLSVNTASITFSNSLANGIIILFAVSTFVTAGSSVSSVSDTAGLTWTKRKSLDDIGSGATFLNVEEWFAKSTGVLTSDVISVVWNQINGSRLYAFGISGANFTTPFDTDASLPGSASSGASTANSLSSTISTASANDLLFACLRSNAALTSVTRPSGFTALNASAGGNQDVSSSIVSARQSSVAEAFSWTGSASQSGLIIDAVQQAYNPIVARSFTEMPCNARNFTGM